MGDDLNSFLNSSVGRAEEENQRLMDLNQSFGSDTKKMRLLKRREKTKINNFLLSLKESNYTKINRLLSSDISESLINSVKPIKVAVDANSFALAQELLGSGFTLPPLLLYDAVLKANLDCIEALINNRLYLTQGLEVSLWFLCYKSLFDQANLLLNRETATFAAILEAEVTSIEDLGILNNNEAFLKLALSQALTYAWDEAACGILRVNYRILTTSMVLQAINSGCTEFLKVLWSGDLESEPSQIVKKCSSSPLWDFIHTLVSDSDQNHPERLIKITWILTHYLTQEFYKPIRKIIQWPMLKKSMKVFNTLLHSSEPYLAQEFLEFSELKPNTDDFIIAFSNGNYNICYTMLTRSTLSLDIIEREMQVTLIDLLDNAYSMLFAVETLKRIGATRWIFDLTRNLCLKLNYLIKKKQEIIYCPTPLLFCVLVVDLMEDFMKYSTKYNARCLSTKRLYITLATSIQDSIGEEDSLKHYLTQKDSLNRTVLEIIAKDKLYQLLENDDVDLLVTKMWMGSENYYEVYKASSIYISANAPLGSDESLQFISGIDMSKPYSFQIQTWKGSCNNKFYGFGVAVLGLIVLYQVFLYEMVATDSIVGSDITQKENALLRVIELMVFGIACEQINGIIAALAMGNRVKFNGWKVNDWLISGLIIFIAAEIPKSLYQEGNLRLSRANLATGVLHCVMLSMLCVKYISILITSKAFGQFLSMTLLIFKEIVTFFILFFMLTLCFAACFTLMFREVEVYSQLDISLRTLFMAIIGPYDINVFTEHPVFGSIMLAVFLLIGHILLLNLLVGIVSNVFNLFQERIESEHRAVLIKSYYKNAWHEEYGMLNFVPTPFTIFPLVLSPLVLFTKNPQYWNSIITKVLYIVYAVPYFAVFVVMSALYLPYLYLLGFVIYGKTGTEATEKKAVNIFVLADEEVGEKYIKFSVLKSLAWTFLGIFWLLYAFFRDCAQFWIVAYMNHEVAEEEQEGRFFDETFVKNLQKTLKNVKEELLSPEEFYQAFIFFDKINNELTDERSEALISYFRQLANPKEDNKLEISRLRKLFFRGTAEKYSEEYISRVQHCNLIWLIKGLISFQTKTGSFEGLKPASSTNEENQKPFDDEISKVETQVEAMFEKVRVLTKACRGILKSKN